MEMITSITIRQTADDFMLAGDAQDMIDKVLGGTNLQLIGVISDSSTGKLTIVSHPGANSNEQIEELRDILQVAVAGQVDTAYARALDLRDIGRQAVRDSGRRINVRRTSLSERAEQLMSRSPRRTVTDDQNDKWTQDEFSDRIRNARPEELEQLWTEWQLQQSEPITPPPAVRPITPPAARTSQAREPATREEPVTSNR